MEDLTPQTQPPQQQISATPPEIQKIPVEEHSTASRSHKGLIIAAIIALVMGVIGVSTFIGFDSSGRYRGYIKKIEDQTMRLETNSEVKTPEQAEMPIPDTESPVEDEGMAR